MKSRYKSKGLITNSEDWYSVRSKVQQDMMRPKSALYYITELEKKLHAVREEVGKMADAKAELQTKADALQEENRAFAGYVDRLKGLISQQEQQKDDLEATLAALSVSTDMQF